MSELTLIGIGSMGAALAHTFLQASVKLTIWNRTSTRPAVRQLVDGGAEFEPELSKAITKSPLIVFCVVSYENIDQLLSELGDPVSSSIFEGKVVLNLGNGTPKQARDMSKKMHKSMQVSKYFDGGIMVTPEAVGSPSAFVFVSGENSESDFDGTVAKQIVSRIGTPHYVGPDPGAAALYDLAALSAMYGLFAGSFTAMAFLRKSPSSAKIEEPVSKFVVPLIQSMAPHLSQIAKKWDDKDWSNGGNPLDMQRIGLGNLLQACKEEGVDGGSLKHFTEIMERGVQEFDSDGGIAQIGPLFLR